MSREREIDPRRWSEEDLVEWVLDARLRDEVPREALERDPDVAARLGELESFLGSCRSSLAEELEPASPELVERILASTTREDLSWRGDLRLVGGFLQQRLRSSRLLRLVAASLLLHVIALPVLAYFTLFQPVEQRTRIGFETPSSELPYAPDELEPEREVQDPIGDELGAHRLLRERLDLEAFPDVPDLAGPGTDPLSLVLWCEVLMDELEAPEPAAGRIEHLQTALGELEKLLEPSGDPSALQRLAASAWLRASAAGWAAADPGLRSLCRDRLEGGTELSAEEWARSYREADAE